MGDEELSRKDIENALNTNDRDTYDSEVTRLRQKAVLAEIRTNAEAKNMAFFKKKDKRVI